MGYSNTYIRSGFWRKNDHHVKGELSLDEVIKLVTGIITNAQGVNVYGDLIPALDNTYVLGNAQFRWKDIRLGEGTLYMTDSVTGAEAELTVENGVLLVNGVSLLSIAGIEFGDNTQQSTAYIPAVAQSFNPLFTDVSATTAGSTVTGSYTMIAPKICFFRVRVDFATCTNFGTGQYQITLPFPAISTLRQADGILHQLTGGALYHIAGIVDSDTAPSSIMKLYYSGSTTDLNWKFNTPVGGTTVTSHFDISGTYEIV